MTDRLDGLNVALGADRLPLVAVDEVVEWGERAARRRTFRRVGVLTVCSLAGVALGFQTTVLPWPMQNQGPKPAPPAARPMVTPPASVPAETAVTLDNPKTGQRVHECEITRLTVTSLARDKTLMVARRNITTGEMWYYSGVSDWDKPNSIDGAWNVKTYYGSGDTSVGQKYQVELVELDLLAARAAFTNGDGTGQSSALPPTSIRRGTATVTRVSGVGSC